MTPRISRRQTLSLTDKFKKDESEVRQTNLELKIAGPGFKMIEEYFKTQPTLNLNPLIKDLLRRKSFVINHL